MEALEPRSREWTPATQHGYKAMKKFLHDLAVHKVPSSASVAYHWLRGGEFVDPTPGQLWAIPHFRTADEYDQHHSGIARTFFSGCRIYYRKQGSLRFFERKLLIFMDFSMKNDSLIHLERK